MCFGLQSPNINYSVLATTLTSIEFPKMHFIRDLVARGEVVVFDDSYSIPLFEFNSDLIIYYLINR